MHRASHRRSHTGRLLLLLTLAGTVVTLTHCRSVGDRLDGVGVGQFKRPGSCFDSCYDVYRKAVKAESDLHASLVKNCKGNEACLSQEEARHEAALTNIQADRIHCQNNCHQQGGGSAGH